LKLSVISRPSIRAVRSVVPGWGCSFETSAVQARGGRNSYFGVIEDQQLLHVCRRPSQKLDLLQFAADLVAQPATGPATIVQGQVSAQVPSTKGNFACMHMWEETQHGKTHNREEKSRAQE
jgi:hypothetical protein